MSENSKSEAESTIKSNASVWVRNGLILLGVYSMIEGIVLFDTIGQTVSDINSDSIDREQKIFMLLSDLVIPFILFFLGFYLIRQSHVITAWNFSEEEVEVKSWEPAAYKLGMTLAAIFLLSWTFPEFGYLVYIIACNISNGSIYGSLPYICTAIWFLVLTAFAVYLLYGAPHIVRWQLRRGKSSEAESDNEDLVEDNDSEPSE